MVFGNAMLVGSMMDVDDDDVADSDVGDASIDGVDVRSSPDFFFLLRPSELVLLPLSLKLFFPSVVI